MTTWHQISRRGFLGASAAGLAGVALSGPALGQSFPTRPIRWICYQAAGGSMDLTMRAYIPSLEKQGIRIQIEYVTGGSGNPARTQVFNAPPDGYLIGLDTAPGAVLNEVVAGAAFKALQFSPIFGWAVDGWQICTRKDGPIKTAADLVTISKTRPVTAASIGRGSTSHLQLLVLAETLGIRMNIVHFSGSAQAYPQAIGGNVDIAIGGPGSAARARDSLHIVGVIRDKEPALPDVSSFKTQGFNVPEINQTWYVSTAPKVPADRMARLTDAFSKAYDDPEFVAAQKKIGFVTLEKLLPADILKINQAAFALAEKYKDQLGNA